MTRFLLPLAITAIVLEFGGQVLSGGMARVPRATETLAAYGLAWVLVLFLTSPVAKVKQLSLVLVDSRDAHRKVLTFVLVMGLTLGAGLLALASTAFGDWVIDDLHGVEDSVGAPVRIALLSLAPFPLLKGLALFYAGLLIRRRRTDIVSYAMIVSIAASIAAVFILLPLPWVRAEPIRLPVLAIYANVLLELAIVYWGVRRLAPSPGRQSENSATLSYGHILRFFWPLALIMIVQELSRPVINLFVARGPNSVEALAVLAIVFSLVALPYRWLNEIPNLAPAFQQEPDFMRHIRRFTVACGLVSFGIMLLLFWTPLRDVILQDWIGISPQLAALSRAPLLIFSFISFVVATRAYFYGVALVERRTQSMAASAPARLFAIVAALFILPFFGFTGAVMGISALFAGFVVETWFVWWGVRGRQIFIRRRVALQQTRSA